MVFSRDEVKLYYQNLKHGDPFLWRVMYLLPVVSFHLLAKV